MSEKETGQHPVEWRETKLKRISDFPKLVKERQEIAATIKELQERLQEINGRLLPLVEGIKEDMVKVDDWRVTLVRSHAPSRLDKTRLVELGVSPQIITKATIEGKETVYLKVTALTEEV